MTARQTGFTVIELMVVIVIIGILVGIALPTIASSIERAKVSSVKVNARTVQTMLALYSTDHRGTFPDTVAQLRQEALAGNYWKTIHNPYDSTQPAVVDFAGTFTIPGAVGYEVDDSQKLRFHLYGADRTLNRIQANGQDFVLSNG